MGFRIKTNVASINAQKSLGIQNRREQEVTQQLSTGQRINKSSDDAAGLAISEKLKANIRSFSQAGRNANDGISMIQVAEGALAEQANMLTRLRELAIQSASDTVGDKERSYTNLEYQQLKEEIDRISQTTKFNDVSLLNGEGDALEFQVGVQNDEKNDRIVYDTGAINSSLGNLGMDGEAVDTKAGAQESLAKVDEAITSIAGQRAILGSIQNRLQVTSSNIDTSVSNMSAANSRIRDVDYAAATAEKASVAVMKNAGTSVLAQANTIPQQALRLIG